MNTASEPVRQGRKLAHWCKEELHRQGDAYLAAIYYFIVPDRDVNLEGINLIKWSINQAIKVCGCGRHIVPSDDIALAQQKALSRNLYLLPKALKRFGLVMHQAEPHDTEKAYFLMHQIFLEMLVTPEICLDNKKYQQCKNDAKILADYFQLGLITLRKAIQLQYQSKTPH